jgi:hypothetical protein
VPLFGRARTINPNAHDAYESGPTPDVPGEVNAQSALPILLALALSDAAIQKMLQQEIKSNSSVPKPDANTLYFIYLPPELSGVYGRNGESGRIDLHQFA